MKIKKRKKIKLSAPNQTSIKKHTSATNGGDAKKNQGSPHKLLLSHQATSHTPFKDNNQYLECVWYCGSYLVVV